MNYPNIDKSAFRRGEYVGYGGGHVWRVKCYGRGDWRAVAHQTADGRFIPSIGARTLGGISAALAAK